MKELSLTNRNSENRNPEIHGNQSEAMQAPCSTFSEWLVYEISHKWLELKFLFFYLSGLAIGYTMPLMPMFHIVTTFVVFDIVTALMAEAAHSKGFLDFWANRFKAAKLKKTVYKLISYSILILLTFMMEKHVVPNTGILKMAMGLIGMVEFASILENIDKTLGTSFLVYFTAFISDMRDKITRKKKKE